VTEPELGLGRVESVEGREIVIAYPARDVVRRYEIESAPLVRARLSEGQLARRAGGGGFCIEEVAERDNLLHYRGEGQELVETDLDAHLDVATPENRLRNGQIDDHRLFDLRREALAIRNRMLASPARGFLGGRIRLFDHQLSIARDVCDRHRIRVLLADEVGLGKTIEALLILHRLLLTGRVERALVFVPPVLVHQWLAEAYLRFNLVLRVVGRDAPEFMSDDDETEDLPSELLASQLLVCPHGVGVESASSLLDSDWGILIVDEAHYLVPGSADFDLVESLAARVEHVVILSATPDHDGEAAHFRRLALLDPARFHDAAAHREESAHYGVLADTAERLVRGDPLDEGDVVLLRERLASPDFDALLEASATDHAAQQVLLRRLLDLHGLGRVMFRNVRARIPGFPRRVPCPVELEGGDQEQMRHEFLSDFGREAPTPISNAAKDPRMVWLRGFLRANAHERMLVLCSSRAKVEAFAAVLGTKRKPVARFHEEMSSIERDRQAAWFLASDGPQVLISSSIGAIGRNFQVARNLVLLDLPVSADRLEQRIGRVDRIGQGDEVRIYAPVLRGSPQAGLRRWYADALHVFDRPWHGSPVIEREFGAELFDALLAADDAGIDDVIDRGRRRNEQIVTELEGGRDRLLELTSVDIDAAWELSEAITHAEENDELERFMVHAFERGGLDVEVIGNRSYSLVAGLDYHRPFPGLVGDAMGVTFDRAIGLEHPERALLTWDHPMVRDTVDTLLAHETGNASIATLRGRGDPPGLLLEALYVAEPTLPKELRADRFFPPTPIRVVVDSAACEFSLDAEKAQAFLAATDSALLEHPQVSALLPILQARARELATERGPAIATAARESMRRELEPAVVRLADLATANPSIAPAELEVARAELATLDEGLMRVRVRLDGLRLIVVRP